MNPSNIIASDTLIEAIARGIAKAKGIEICSDASYRHSTFGPLAQAALTAITEAGFVLAPNKPTREMIDAAYEAHDAYEKAEPPASWCGVSSIYRAMIRATNNGKAE